MADIGVDTVVEFVDQLREDVRAKGITDAKELQPIVVDKMFDIYLKGEIVNSNLRFNKDVIRNTLLNTRRSYLLLVILLELVLLNNLLFGEIELALKLLLVKKVLIHLQLFMRLFKLLKIRAMMCFCVILQEDFKLK